MTLSYDVVQARPSFVKELAPGRRAELRSCVKLEVDVLSSPSPNSIVVSVDVKQH